METELNKVAKKCCRCSKKAWTNYECKCGQIVCLKHRYFYEHNCSRNIKKEWSAEIEEKNPQISNPKVVRI